MYTLKAVGADPEFFLADKKGTPVPAIGLIGGTKDEPKRIFDNDEFSAVQEDNVMVEYNIKPAQTAEDFLANHLSVQAYLQKMINEKNLVPLIRPSMTFTPAQLAHKQAQTMGCEGDFNAWTDRANFIISPKDMGLIRVAGGHVHVSFEVDGKKADKMHHLEVVRMLDLALGLPSVMLDDDIIRRRYYGRAGAFRPKMYGVEYRTLSNFWLTSDRYTKWVFNQVLWAFFRLKNKKHAEPTDGLYIQQAINGAQQGSAWALIEKYEIPMPEGFVKK